MTDKIVIRWVNDEEIHILLNGKVVQHANHDEHGWDGMQLAMDLCRALGGGMGASVSTEGTPNL